MDSEIPDTKNCILMHDEFMISGITLAEIESTLLLCIELLGDGVDGLPCHGVVSSKNALELLRIVKLNIGY